MFVDLNSTTTRPTTGDIRHITFVCDGKNSEIFAEFIVVYAVEAFECSAKKSNFCKPCEV